MPNVCVSRNLKIGVAGKLGLQPWSVPRMVLSERVNSVGDGAYTQQTILPGKIMMNTTLTWINDAPIEQMVMLRVTRAYRDIVVSNPNAVQIRDRWTHRIGGASTVASDPDPSQLLQSQMGASMDLSTNFFSTPLFGRLYIWRDSNTVEDWLGVVPPGQRIVVRYRCTLWTPPPWADNASNNSPLHTANVRWSLLQLHSYPTQDTEVVTG